MTEPLEFGPVEGEVGAGRQHHDLVARGQRPEQQVEGHGLVVDGHGDRQVVPIAVIRPLECGERHARGALSFSIVGGNTLAAHEHAAESLQRGHGLRKKIDGRDPAERGAKSEAPLAHRLVVEPGNTLEGSLDRIEDRCLSLAVSEGGFRPGRPKPALAAGDRPANRRSGARDAVLPAPVQRGERARVVGDREHEEWDGALRELE